MSASSGHSRAPPHSLGQSTEAPASITRY
jgi:hypothetical protein